MPASALAEGQISELADVRASATVPVIDVAVSLSPEADGGGLLMDNADADAGIDVNHLSEMGSIAGEVSFDNNSNTSVRLARIESDATSLNTYFTGTSANIASFKLGSYDELSWSPASGAKTVYELAASDAADPSAGMIVPLGGASSATLSLDVSGLSATSSAREAAKDPASARDLMSLTWVFEAAQTPYEQPGGIRDQIADITPNTLSTVTINGVEYYVIDKTEYNGNSYACLFSKSCPIIYHHSHIANTNTHEPNIKGLLQDFYASGKLGSVEEFIVTARQIGNTKFTFNQYDWLAGFGNYQQDSVEPYSSDMHVFTPKVDPDFESTSAIEDDPVHRDISVEILKCDREWITMAERFNRPTRVIASTGFPASNPLNTGDTRDWGVRPAFWIAI